MRNMLDEMIIMNLSRAILGHVDDDVLRLSNKLFCNKPKLTELRELEIISDVRVTGEALRISGDSHDPK